MPFLKIFDDKDGNGGGQTKSGDLRTMAYVIYSLACVCLLHRIRYLFPASSLCN